MTGISRPTKRRAIPPWILLSGLLLLLVSSCAAQDSGVPISQRWASAEGSQLEEASAGEQFYFNIPLDAAMVATGVPIKIKVSGEVISGSVRFELRHPDGRAVWDSGTISPGDYAISTAYRVPGGQTGTYTLGLVYGADTRASYNLGWHAIQLGPMILLPGAGMIVVGLAFVIYAARQSLLGWGQLGLGALFWALTVAVKFAFAIPLNSRIFQALGVTGDQLLAPGNLAAYLYIGALTGIFEAGLTWLILSRTRWGKADWSQALAFGIGFGVIEALLLGLAGLASALISLLAPDSLPISALGSLANSATLSAGLAPIVERFSVILAHIFACALIYYAIASGESRWGWLAILYKTLLDAPAGFAAFWGAGTASNIWALEAVIAIFGLVGLWGTIQIAGRYARLPETARRAQRP